MKKVFLSLIAAVVTLSVLTSQNSVFAMFGDSASEESKGSELSTSKSCVSSNESSKNEKDKEVQKDKNDAEKVDEDEEQEESADVSTDTDEWKGWQCEEDNDSVNMDDFEEQYEEESDGSIIDEDSWDESESSKVARYAYDAPKQVEGFKGRKREKSRRYDEKTKRDGILDRENRIRYIKGKR